MACNYFPKGNIIGQPVNKLGDPCTSCEEDRASCSRIFKGLCGLGNINIYDLLIIYILFFYYSDSSATRLFSSKYRWTFLLVVNGFLLKIRG